MRKRKRGDRNDAVLVHENDSMHIFMPYLLGKRTDNEAVMNEKVDITAINEFVEMRNSQNPDFKYTVFQIIAAAIAKTIYLRPKMNRFISNNMYYDKNEISLAFVVKKEFSDNGGEALAICRLSGNAPPLEQIREQTCKIVRSVRCEGQNDGATDVMDILTKLPPFLIRASVGILNFLDRHGILPMDLVRDDPYHCSVFISNLGSIKMNANYHHLANWGTNSFFAVIGEKHMEQYIAEDNSEVIHECLNLGLTIDERIADGYYFAKTLRILRILLDNPQLLERPLDEDVDTDWKEENKKNDRYKCPLA